MFAAQFSYENLVPDKDDGKLESRCIWIKRKKDAPYTEIPVIISGITDPDHVEVTDGKGNKITLVRVFDSASSALPNGTIEFVLGLQGVDTSKGEET